MQKLLFLLYHEEHVYAFWSESEVKGDSQGKRQEVLVDSETLQWLHVFMVLCCGVLPLPELAVKGILV